MPGFGAPMPAPAFNFKNPFGMPGFGAPMPAPSPAIKVPQWDPCASKMFGMCVGGMKMSGGKRTKRQRGGSYQFGPSITHGLVNNYGQEVVSGGKPLMPDYNVAAKTDTLGFSGPKGLPGMSGGRRTRQSGGRYGFVAADGAISGPPSMGGMASMSKIPCEGATPNPMNPTQMGGSLGGDNLAHYAPTAGYSNGASTWVGGTGAPSLIQTPYEAKAMNQACLKGGSRKNRKNRKNSRRA